MKNRFRSRRSRNPHQFEKPSKSEPFFDRKSLPGAQSRGGEAQSTLQAREIDTVRPALASPVEDEKLGTAEARMEKDQLVQETRERDDVSLFNQEERVDAMSMDDEEPQALRRQEEEPGLVQQQVAEDRLQEQEEEGALQGGRDEEPPQTMEGEKELQAKGDRGGRAARPSLHDRLKRSGGKGAPLQGGMRVAMERALGKDLSGVRIHTDPGAIEMAEELGAQAFTHGQDIYFNDGKYRPETSQGKHLLAHELAHVLQQRGSELEPKPQSLPRNRGSSDSAE